MNGKNTCGNCGNPLQLNDPGGICPSCLMGHAMQNAANNPTLDATGNSYPRAEELVGQFPNLEILHLLGQGGMGAVYLARQTKLDRVVALKVLSPRLGNDPTFAERFIREAKTLAKLSHPNIVTVFDYGQTDNLNYLLMEYVDGVNLRDAIQSGKLTPKEALAIVPQICDALQYAHDAGVIHRDIKPENILLDQQGHVKIADFGLAKLLDSNQNDFTLTGTNQILGTRNYMAPEQIEKPEVVDHRADIYSLGVVFYELLTGELPIGRFAAPSEKVAVNHQLDDIVMRTLEKEPARRFQQASEIRMAVDSLASYQPPPAAARDANSISHSIATLPFTISELYGGFATAHGIAHLFADRIELEYEVVDDVLGAVKSGSQQVTIPVSSLTDVRMKKGIFSDRIDFQTDRLEIAKDVPNSKQGRFSLGVKRRDIELTKLFVGQIDRIRRGIRQVTTASNAPVAGFQQPSPPQTFRQPAPPQKSDVSEPVNQLALDRQHVIDSLKIQRIGFVVIGVIHLLIAAKGFVRVSTWRELASLNFDMMPSVEVSLFLPRINMGSFHNFIVLAIGILLLSIASRLRRPRDYKFVFVALILVMIIPIHFAYMITLGLSIWALVIMCDHRTKNVFAIADGGGPGAQRGTANSTAGCVLGIVGVSAAVIVACLALALIMPLATWQPSPKTQTETGVALDEAGSSEETEEPVESTTDSIIEADSEADLETNSDAKLDVESEAESNSETESDSELEPAKE